MADPSRYVDSLDPLVDLADERALMVRVWCAEGESWRGVAARATEAWGIDYGTNQLYGRDLCRLAAAWLGESVHDPPWYEEHPVRWEEWH